MGEMWFVGVFVEDAHEQVRRCVKGFVGKDLDEVLEVVEGFLQEYIREHNSEATDGEIREMVGEIIDIFEERQRGVEVYTDTEIADGLFIWLDGTKAEYVG